MVTSAPTTAAASPSTTQRVLPASRRFREVADRADDVQPAHAQAGADNRCERHGKTDGEGLSETRGHDCEGHVEVVVLGREDPRRDGDEKRAEADPGRHAECRCGECIEPPFGRKGADQLRPAHADCAGHAELCLPLGREHHEQVDEQEESGDHAEAAHCREHGRERRPDLVGQIERAPLHGVDLWFDACCCRGRANLASGVVGTRRAALDAACVRHRHRPAWRHPIPRAGANPVEGLRRDEHVVRLLLRP